MSIYCSNFYCITLARNQLTRLMTLLNSTAGNILYNKKNLSRESYQIEACNPCVLTTLSLYYDIIFFINITQIQFLYFFLPYIIHYCYNNFSFPLYYYFYLNKLISFMMTTLTIKDENFFSPLKVIHC